MCKFFFQMLHTYLGQGYADHHGRIEVDPKGVYHQGYNQALAQEDEKQAHRQYVEMRHQKLDRYNQPYRGHEQRREELLQIFDAGLYEVLFLRRRKYEARHKGAQL